MPISFKPDLSVAVALPPQGSWPDGFHRFDRESVWAVQMAISTGRPLLLRGEPGIGKSQLARAVAVVLKVPFLYHVVDERSERDDLLHPYDAVARLAEAQISSLSAANDPTRWREALRARNFMQPGILWWAYDWPGASLQAQRFRHDGDRDYPEPVIPEGWSPDGDRPCGPVVLIDEIDKADASIPNGLLECMGNQGFQFAQGSDGVRAAKGAKQPLIFITTNEERELPAAFLRRCLVLPMVFPTARADGVRFLCERGEALAAQLGVSAEVCQAAAECICDDRGESRGRMALPGVSEFLDLVRALADQHPADKPAQLTRLNQLKKFVLCKHDATV